MDEPRRPLDAALDVLVYVPVGLVLTAAEELPKLAAKGRSRVTTQLTMARVVGQFAVAQGRVQLEKRWNPMGAAPSADRGPFREGERGITYEDILGGSEEAASLTGGPDITSRPQGWPDPFAPASSGLAIPGYDSLSAPQVVQRLEGLSGEELAAVGAYEQAHRARRTILNRVSQLQDQ